jgi:hypothetical protein
VAKSLAPPDGGLYVDGLRAALRAEYEAEVLRGDPRVHAAFTEDWTSAERRQANDASPAIRHARRRVEALDAGEVVTTGRPSARVFPELLGAPWWTDTGVRLVTVAADDTLRPIYE